MRRFLILAVITILAGIALAACGSADDSNGGSMPRAGASDPVLDTPSVNTATADPLWLALQGRWESGLAGQNDGTLWASGTPLTLVFEGDSVFEYGYVRFYSDRYLTQDCFENGYFHMNNSIGRTYRGEGLSPSQRTLDGESIRVISNCNGNMSFQDSWWWRGGDTGVLREIVDIERLEREFDAPLFAWVGERVTIPTVDDVRPVDLHVVLVRERREGTFALDPDGERIELLWNCDRGHMSSAFRFTENALAPDVIRIGTDWWRVEG